MTDYVWVKSPATTAPIAWFQMPREFVKEGTETYERPLIDPSRDFGKHDHVVLWPSEGKVTYVTRDNYSDKDAIWGLFTWD